MAKGKKTGGRNFKPGESGNPNGAPPSPIELKLLKLLTMKEFKTMVCVLFFATEEGVRRVLADPDESTLNKIIAQALKNARDDGNYLMLDRILDRVLGKPKEVVEIQDERPPRKPLSDEERAKLLKIARGEA